MARLEAERYSKIGPAEEQFRKIGHAILTKTIVRSERLDDQGGIKKATEALKKGDGLVIIINHFSLREPIDAVLEAFANEIMTDRPVIAPITYHQFKPWQNRFLKYADVTLKPIVTQGTVNKGKNDGLELGEGKGQYVKDSLDLLSQGGIVILAPQGTRQGHLGQPENRNVGTLLSAARRNKVKNISFLFIGFGIKGVDDYSSNKVRGLNLLKKYDKHIGPCFTKDELMEKAQGDIRLVDQVVFEILRELVPESYR